jgi:uncharacterized peroxidase-related enzyme
MAFIRTTAPHEAQGAALEMYRQVEQAMGHIPNWALAFSLRPGVRAAWAALQASIRSNLSVRSYELATLAAARALRSSYCSLAHGKILTEKVFDAAAVTAIMQNAEAAPLEPRERSMMAFAERVALAADRVTAADIDELRSHGYSDEEIFDLAATAAARCFFSKLLDALGVQADAAFHDLEPGLREALTVGRPVTARAPRPPAEVSAPVQT